VKMKATGVHAGAEFVVKNKPPVVVPPAALRRAGFKRGEDLEVKAAGGVITVVPKRPAAADE
jgi:antitoxin component of MazEF toxin-antitoxin module